MESEGSYLSEWAKGGGYPHLGYRLEMQIPGPTPDLPGQHLTGRGLGICIPTKAQVILILTYISDGSHLSGELRRPGEGRQCQITDGLDAR